MATVKAPFALGTASSHFYKLCAFVLKPASRRHQSSYRRTRQRLNVKPDASFLPSKTEPHDHIIYNPPPSMPNVYHTPTIFLPKNDPRRKLQPPVPASTSTGLSTLSSMAAELPPPVRPIHERRWLTKVEIEEIRSLRKDSPAEWTNGKLAKKFDCPAMLISLATKGIAREHKEQQKALQKQVTEIVQSNWSKARRTAREDRQLRKERWYRDE